MPTHTTASDKNTASGICGLDASAYVPAAQLGLARKAGGSYGSDRSAVGFNANVTPTDTTRDCEVLATVKISGSIVDGKVEACTDANATPTTVVATAEMGNSVAASGIVFVTTLTFTVKAGEKYRLNTTNVTNTPSFSLVMLKEKPL